MPSTSQAKVNRPCGVDGCILAFLSTFKIQFFRFEYPGEPMYMRWFNMAFKVNFNKHFVAHLDLFTATSTLCKVTFWCRRSPSTTVLRSALLALPYCRVEGGASAGGPHGQGVGFHK